MYMKNLNHRRNIIELKKRYEDKFQNCKFIVFQYLKKIIIVTIFFYFTTGYEVYSQDSLKKNTLGMEWRNNIFGNTLSIGYKYDINHFGVGLLVGKGFFQYKIGDKSKFLNFQNIPVKDNIFSVDISQMISLFMFYRLNNKTSLEFLNYYEFGISSINFVFRINIKGKILTENL